MMKGRKGGTRSKLPFVVVGVFCLIIIIGFASIMQSCGALSSSTTAPSSNPPATTTQPPVVVKTLSLKVTKSTYEYGYLKLTGVLTNTCNASIFSPTVKLQIWGKDGSVLLGSDSAWPVGGMLEDFPPGSSSAIDFFTSVSGEPGSITYRLSCEDANLTVTYPKD
jgi:hypothetical protein